MTYELRPIGRVESPLVDLADAPLQGDEGAPESWLVFDEAISEAFAGLHQGSEIFVLTWLDQARRDVLGVHPRGNPANPKQGVFNTRSPDRPNPIGLHRVVIVAIDANRIRVRDLEAINGTPVLDIKPILHPTDR
jgi:tRNA-Thr(GGU) m(6)t(6)A37 methyltransferase TsaA